MSARFGPLRIGEFARRVDVTPDLLRAWERRYGLLQPVRSSGGFRLYSEDDAERVARMRRALDDGLSAAEAARAALDRGLPSTGLLEDGAGRLLAAIERYDEAEAHAVLDAGLAACGLELVLRDVIFPTLTQVGLRWEQGTLEIGHEHFASQLIRGRLLSLARLWNRGAGPLGLLACGPGEKHDISLIAFGLLLSSHGWRILFLGADTPIATIIQTAQTTRPELAVLVSFNPAPLPIQVTALHRLAKIASLVLAGPGASDPLCAQLGARRLNGDLIAAAKAIATGQTTERPPRAPHRADR
ncbi:MAG: MerR family transcriptional regulator [Actinomycetota bacterium]|nr:MerR family transcriptional regulator [Actinomycetota bacterium]